MPVFLLCQATINAKESPPIESDDNLSLELLRKLFSDTSMFKKEPSRRVVLNGGKGPFSHCEYPIGGFRLNRDPSLSPKGSNTAHHAAVDYYLPDGPSVQTPPQASSPSAEVSQQRPVVRETIVELSPKKKVTKAAASNSSMEDSEPSDQVKDLLQRVPDLSFMLSSKLSLPRK